MTGSPRIYVLDTNIFLRNPDCLLSFRDARVIVPLTVVEELGNLKTKLTEIGRNARIALKNLESLRLQGSLQEGVRTKGGTVVCMGSFSERHPGVPSYLDMGKNVNRMLSAFLSIAESAGGEARLVTNDFGLKVLAAGMGLAVEGFEEESAGPETGYDSILRVDLAPDDFQALAANQGLICPGYLREKEGGVYPNMHALVGAEGAKADSLMLCRYIGRNNLLKPVSLFPKGVWDVVPRNTEQAAAFDLLVDEAVSIVVLAGKAGTGKTLIALAAALAQLSADKPYRKIHVSRPIIPMGRELGYLPGDLDEKLSPWMQPIFDNLEYLAGRNNKLGDHRRLAEKGLIELEALSYIRGRSIPNRFMIVDEAQNLSPHEVKTILTRVGDNTKIVLTGDPYQIDNAYLDSASNGLTYVIEKLKDYEISGHVYLKKGERSPLAELASNVL